MLVDEGEGTPRQPGVEGCETKTMAGAGREGDSLVLNPRGSLFLFAVALLGKRRMLLYERRIAMFSDSAPAATVVDLHAARFPVDMATRHGHCRARFWAFEFGWVTIYSSWGPDIYGSWSLAVRSLRRSETTRYHSASEGSRRGEPPEGRCHKGWMILEGRTRQSSTKTTEPQFWI